MAPTKGYSQWSLETKVPLQCHTRYSAVPQNVLVFSSANPGNAGNCLERPKSVRTICPSSARRMFSGFKSLFGGMKTKV